MTGRVNKTTVIYLITCGLVLIDARAQHSPTTDNRIDSLLFYVRKQYGLRTDVELALKDTGARYGAYKEIRVFSRSPMQPFEVNLYLSPDERYLVSEVMDLSEDPITHSQRARERLQQRLIATPAYARLGSSGAPVSIVMFTDFQCEFCRQAAELLEKEVFPAYSGKMCFVVRHHPLPSHDWARSAAEAAICAGIQSSDLFWKLHDFIFRSQAQLTAAVIRTSIEQYLSDVPQFNEGTFNNCLSSDEPKKILLDDENLAQGLGVNATPTFYIDGMKQVGMSDATQFKQLVVRRLASAAQ